MVVHAHHVRRVHVADVRWNALAVRRHLALEARNITDEADLVGALECVVDGAADDLAGSAVASHRVDRDAHRC